MSVTANVAQSALVESSGMDCFFAFSGTGIVITESNQGLRAVNPPLGATQFSVFIDWWGGSVNDGNPTLSGVQADFTRQAPNLSRTFTVGFPGSGADFTIPSNSTNFTVGISGVRRVPDVMGNNSWQTGQVLNDPRYFAAPLTISGVSDSQTLLGSVDTLKPGATVQTIPTSLTGLLQWDIVDGAGLQLSNRETFSAASWQSPTVAITVNPGGNVIQSPVFSTTIALSPATSMNVHTDVYLNDNYLGALHGNEPNTFLAGIEMTDTQAVFTFYTMDMASGAMLSSPASVSLPVNFVAADDTVSVTYDQHSDVVCVQPPASASTGGVWMRVSNGFPEILSMPDNGGCVARNGRYESYFYEVGNEVYGGAIEFAPFNGRACENRVIVATLRRAGAIEHVMRCNLEVQRNKEIYATQITPSNFASTGEVGSQVELVWIQKDGHFTQEEYLGEWRLTLPTLEDMDVLVTSARADLVHGYGWQISLACSVVGLGRLGR